MHVIRRVFTGLVAVGAVGWALVLGPAAHAAAPIAPGQRFAGIVNGGRVTTTMPVVYTVCGGPTAVRVPCDGTGQVEFSPPWPSGRSPATASLAAWE